MSELSVYYCPRCGRFGYFQFSRHAFCPACSQDMQPLDMRYTAFARLSPAERDNLLIQKILQSGDAEGPVLPADVTGYCQLVAALHTKIMELETENRQLSGTVDWMHKTIWDLLAQKQELARRLSAHS